MEPLDPFFDFLATMPTSFDLLRPEDRALFLRHIRTCPACDALVRRQLAGLAELREGVEEEGREVTAEQVARVEERLVEGGVLAPRPAGRGPLRLLTGGWTAPLRVAAAALLLVGAAGGAAIAYTLAHRLATVGPVGGLDQVDTWEDLGFPFESLGVPPDFLVADRLSFPVEGDARGILFAVVEPRDPPVLRMAAFGEDRSALWDGAGSWEGVPGWSGGRGAVFEGMKLVRSKPRAGAPGEWEASAALFTGEGRDTLLTLFSPATGSVDFRYRDPGTFVEGGNMETLQVLPGEPGGRPFLLGGRRGEGLSARPVMVLLGPDGSPRQEVELPVLRPRKNREMHVSILRVDHRSDPCIVHVDTHEGVHYQFPVVGGRLDASRVEVRFGDNVLTRLRSEMETKEEYDRFLAESGDEKGLLAGLAAGVRDVPEGQFKGKVLR